jgi:hypothetical protein
MPIDGVGRGAPRAGLAAATGLSFLHPHGGRHDRFRTAGKHRHGVRRRRGGRRVIDRDEQRPGILVPLNGTTLSRLMTGGGTAGKGAISTGTADGGRGW